MILDHNQDVSRMPSSPRRPQLRRALLGAVAGSFFLAAMSACGDSEGEALRSTLTGEQLFKQPFPAAGNQRSCATCHVPEDNFTLTPAHVARVWETNPNDPLFSAIDADDPTASPLTFEHLKKGLIRVGLTLPANMDVIDDAGNVITPPDRQIFVWRSVPSIADSALTPPYQLDGRVATLEEQAQGAITGHSEGGTAPASELTRLAKFEKTLFSSDRARSVAKLLASGASQVGIRDPDWPLLLTQTEQRGRAVYEAVCAACHGGANKATITNQEVHAMAFPELKPNGTVRYQVPATEPPQIPFYVAQPDNKFINIGSAFENYLAHVDATEHVSFTKDLSFPQYRFKFYRDATRTEVTAILPPILPRDPEIPLAPVSDEDGNFILGPNFATQDYSTDPGRAAITGNPYDFEAFDIPTLRGIAKTAPYWHSNISETLEGVVELYSDHLLSKFPTLVQPGEKETDEGGDIGPEQTMTRQQKDDLVAFLKRL
jgi:cytochrome c peroxidase